jgi:hypothetical protein
MPYLLMMAVKHRCFLTYETTSTWDQEHGIAGEKSILSAKGSEYQMPRHGIPARLSASVRVTDYVIAYWEYKLGNEEKAGRFVRNFIKTIATVVAPTDPITASPPGVLPSTTAAVKIECEKTYQEVSLFSDVPDRC